MRHIPGILLAILAAGGIHFFYVYIEQGLESFIDMPWWAENVLPLALSAVLAYVIALLMVERDKG